MKNALCGILAVTCIFACGQAVGAEKSAKIVDEKRIFALGDEVNRRKWGVEAMRLSPDGTKLLFIRRRGADRKTRSYKLMQRALN